MNLIKADSYHGLLESSEKILQSRRFHWNKRIFGKFDFIVVYIPYFKNILT